MAKHIFLETLAGRGIVGSWLAVGAELMAGSE